LRRRPGTPSLHAKDSAYPTSLARGRAQNNEPRDTYDRARTGRNLCFLGSGAHHTNTTPSSPLRSGSSCSPAPVCMTDVTRTRGFFLVARPALLENTFYTARIA